MPEIKVPEVERRVDTEESERMKDAMRLQEHRTKEVEMTLQRLLR